MTNNTEESRRGCVVIEEVFAHIAILANSDAVARLTFFHSAATCLHVPATLTPEPAKHEGRKPRASERHVVGCCEELGAGFRERLCRRAARKTRDAQVLVDL